MVKQRFLTHFKPWLFAVIKVVGLIVGYQVFDETRTYLQYAPLNSVDVVVAATVGLIWTSGSGRNQFRNWRVGRHPQAGEAAFGPGVRLR